MGSTRLTFQEHTMIRIRTLALGAALVFGVATTAAAQQGQGHGGGRRQGHGEMRQGNAGMHRALLRGIELTDAQKSQLKTLHAKHVDERRALRDSATRGDSASRAALQALTARQAQDLRAILTPAQVATFDANVSAMRDRRAGKREDRRDRRDAPRGAKTDSTKRS